MIEHLGSVADLGCELEGSGRLLEIPSGAYSASNLPTGLSGSALASRQISGERKGGGCEASLVLW